MVKMFKVKKDELVLINKYDINDDLLSNLTKIICLSITEQIL